MTGVGGRPEVIIEGSNSLDSGWKEYEFYYKPGNVSKVPPIVGKVLKGERQYCIKYVIEDIC
jgi:hypothetical protein